MLMGVFGTGLGPLYSQVTSSVRFALTHALHSESVDIGCLSVGA